MSGDESADDHSGPVANMQSAMQAFKGYVRNQLDEMRVEVNQNSEEIEALRAQVDQLDAKYESLAGLADGENSTKAKRAADLRQALIRAAESADDGTKGRKWWWREVRDNLATLGHGGFSKPTYHDAMEHAAKAEGFDMDTKIVQTQPGREQEVKAIRVTLDDLPTRGGRNQSTTTNGGVGAARDTERGSETTRKGL